MGTFVNLNHNYMSIPRTARGYSRGDFIHFQIDNQGLDANSLCAFIEDLTAEGQYRMGAPRESMKIPNIYLPPKGKVWVNGKNKAGANVSFWGYMNRGSIYVLNTSEPGTHFMQSFTSNVNCSCCPYNTSTF